MQSERKGTEWPFPPPVTPVEARVEDCLPEPPGWAYEPKWDGFRAVSWGGGSHVRLDSRNHKTLLRYFPELEPALRRLPAGTVVDGEVVVVTDGVRLDFDALQSRIHPAESRIRLLAQEIPASLIAFDLLACMGEDLRDHPFRDRRRLLVELLRGLEPPWYLTPSTEDVELARRWFRDFESAGFDGVVAKRLDRPYCEGKRDMVKVKHRRTVDVVVGGYRVHKDGGKVGSLLLGLYTADGELHFIGHCSGFGARQATALYNQLQGMRTDGESFGENVRRPGAESRWSAGKDLSWISVRPELVVEVSYDQLTGDRIRHATRFERWRPDKDPQDCTMDQLARPGGLGFYDIVSLAG